MSSGGGRCLQLPVEGAGEVALEAAGRFAEGLALALASLDVGDRRRVVFASADDDVVQGAVEFAVAAAVEPVAHALAGGGGDRGGSGEAGEGGLVFEPAGV